MSIRASDGASTVATAEAYQNRAARRITASLVAPAVHRLLARADSVPIGRLLKEWIIYLSSAYPECGIVAFDWQAGDPKGLERWFLQHVSPHDRLVELTGWNEATGFLTASAYAFTFLGLFVGDLPGLQGCIASAFVDGNGDLWREPKYQCESSEVEVYVWDDVELMAILRSQVDVDELTGRARKLSIPTILESGSIA